MSGAAAVLGVLKVLPRLKPAIEVHGLVAATDNMPSGSATKPGDVLRAMNGKTIEVNNTDAEGRLTLADAIAYARKEIKPDEIVDIATLTGACSIALGSLCAGAMSNNAALQARVMAAGARAGERLWPLPLIDEYREGLRSEVADLRNTGPRPGGAITAGLFIREFAGDTPWVHLDIAGVAFTDKELPYAREGRRRVRRPHPHRVRARRRRAGVRRRSSGRRSTSTRTRSPRTAPTRPPSWSARPPGAACASWRSRITTRSTRWRRPSLAARDHPPLEIVPGIEINTDDPGGEIHVLGYFLDHEARVAPATSCGSSGPSGRRACTASRTGWRRSGHPIDAEEVFALVQEGSAGRPHVAQVMVRRGYVGTVREAFDRFLAAGKPAYVGTPEGRCLGRRARSSAGPADWPSWRIRDSTRTPSG